MRVLLVHNRYQQRAGEDRSFDAERTFLAADPAIELSEFVVDSREIDDYTRSERAALGLRTTWSTQTRRRLTELLSRSPVDIAHFHNTFPLISPAAYEVCRDSGARVIQTIRNFRQFCANGLFFRDGHVCEDCVGRVPRWPGVLHRCYHGSVAQSTAVVAMQTAHAVRGTWRKDVDAYIALTDFVARKVAEAGLPAELVHVKPDIVTPDPGFSHGPRGHALYIGRLTYEKGIFTLLDAWRTLADVPLVVIGTGPEEGSVRRRVAEEGLEASVRIAGEATDEDVVEALAHARFVVVPSMSYETFGRTAVEAYAAGTPVLAARIGALAETVVEGETGLLFDPGDASGLAGAARKMWDDARMIESMSRAARARYEAVYAPEVVHARLTSLYAEQLG